MEIASAISGITATFKLLQGAVAARDDAKVQAALIDANSKLLDLSTAALGIAEKLDTTRAALRNAEDELRELKLAAAERDRYTLTEIRPGAYAYAAKTEEGQGVQPPYLCQPCYDRGVKSVLRSARDFNYSPLLWACGENAKHTFEQREQGNG